jgi:acylphosphatase
MMKIIRKKVHVEGRVQGVGYRMFARDLAAQYHVSGWVKNLETGSVEAEIEGDLKIVDEVIEGLYARDSYIIRVDRITATEIPPEGSYEFVIRR